MDKLPFFCYPNKFSEISGLSAKEVRNLCQQQLIPNERTNRGFRIDVKGALVALQARAANFVGHSYKIKQIYTPSITLLRLNKNKSFKERLDDLKRNNTDF